MPKIWSKIKIGLKFAKQKKMIKLCSEEKKFVLNFCHKTKNDN